MSFFVVFCIAVILMFSEHQFEYVKTLRMQLSIVVYPIQRIVDFPTNVYYLSHDYFVSKRKLVEENDKLKEEQFILKGKLQMFDALALENVRLKELLNSATTTVDDLLIASILRIDPKPFMHQIVLDKGSDFGVYIGQPVIDAHGIVGSIIEVNALTSRAMLLTDINYAVPVENTRNGVRAIAMGTGVLDYLELKHVTNTTDITTGDKLVTSGLDGRYPAGYPVGIVNSVEHNASNSFASIYVAPSAELERGRQVLLIKYKGKYEPAKG